jgi:hypothetical protein
MPWPSFFYRRFLPLFFTVVFYLRFLPSFFRHRFQPTHDLLLLLVFLPWSLAPQVGGGGSLRSIFRVARMSWKGLRPGPCRPSLYYACILDVHHPVHEPFRDPLGPKEPCMSKINPSGEGGARDRGGLGDGGRVVRAQPRFRYSLGGPGRRTGRPMYGPRLVWVEVDTRERREATRDCAGEGDCSRRVSLYGPLKLPARDQEKLTHTVRDLGPTVMGIGGHPMLVTNRQLTCQSGTVFLS